MTGLSKFGDHKVVTESNLEPMVVLSTSLSLLLVSLWTEKLPLKNSKSSLKVTTKKMLLLTQLPLSKLLLDLNTV